MAIKITKNAIEAIKKEYYKKETNEKKIIRISVKGGGCSGFTYKLSKEEEKSELDIEIKIEELDFIIDIFTINFLKDAIIDFMPNYSFESSFIFNTPFSKAKCSGCK